MINRTKLHALIGTQGHCTRQELRAEMQRLSPQHNVNGLRVVVGIMDGSMDRASYLFTVEEMS